VLPVIEQLAAKDVKVSVDTRRKIVAEAAVKAGAIMVNDISFGEDDAEMFPFMRSCPAHVVYCGMHKRGMPKTMGGMTQYDNLVPEVAAYLAERARLLDLPPWRTFIDPGLGFAKDNEQNLLLIKNLEAFRRIPAALLVGFSKKRHVAYAAGVTTGTWDHEKTRIGNLAMTALCYKADVLRVHDVAETKIVLDVVHAVENAKAPLKTDEDV